MAEPHVIERPSLQKIHAGNEICKTVSKLPLPLNIAYMDQFVKNKVMSNQRENGELLYGVLKCLEP